MTFYPKILHLSTSDNHGAFSAAYRFHKNIINHGYESLFLVKRKTLDDDSVIQVNDEFELNTTREIFFQKIQNLTNFDSKYYFMDRGKYSLSKIEDFEKEVDFKPDVIMLHWISSYLNLDLLANIREKYNDIRFFWYFMDMAPMTGGCHYAWDCEGYKQECLNCPAIKFLYKDLAHMNFLRKIRILNQLNICAIAPTTWLKRQIEDSTLFKNRPIYNLMLGVDETVFKPMNRLLIREKYQILNFKKILLFRSTKDPRKGMNVLIQSLKLIVQSNVDFTNKVYIITIGDFNPSKALVSLGLEHCHMGFISSQEVLAEMYQIADFLVVPSLEDSGPMMINESILCGTPVVAFDMGVAGDLVKTGKTGYLARLGDKDDLAFGIQLLLNMTSKSYEEMRVNCRNIGLSKVSYKAQISHFLEIVQTAL
jgi:glycosyltransferase involved in cell wall biosynthesis